jgi:aquaporin Z
MEQAMLSPRLGAEAFGTFCLIFAGAGAAVVNEVTGGGVTNVGVARVFGLVVMAMIYALGNVSGCHINPAVTLGLCAAGRFDRCLVLPYIGSQCVGAFLASGTLRILFPESRTLGATIPAGSDIQIGEYGCVRCCIAIVTLRCASFAAASFNACCSAASASVSPARRMQAMLAMFRDLDCGMHTSPLDRQTSGKGQNGPTG